MKPEKIINIQDHLFIDTILDASGLTCRIIKSYQEFGIIDIRTKEGQSFAELGLYPILDSICENFEIPKHLISLTNNNWTEKHPEYEIRKAPFNYELSMFHAKNPFVPYVGNKFYGLFIGRADTSRIKAMVLSNKRKIPCLTSFNDDLSTPFAESKANALIANGFCSKEEIKSLKVKHSDVDNIKMVPILPPHNIKGVHWQESYSKIALEIVCETTDWPDSFHITEKICRPIYYRRPFILIGARNFMSRLRDMGFRTFTDVIPNFYENFDYCAEEAFQCLDRLWNSDRYRANPGLLLEDLRDDLEHNYSLLIEIANQHRDKSIELGGLKYFGNQ